MKRPLLFLGKLLLISLVLVPVFFWFDGYYFNIIESANRSKLNQFDCLSSVALYPFFVLVLATPGLGIRRRIMSIVLAIILALTIDLTMIHVWGTYPFKQEPNQTLGQIWAGESWYVMMRWLLPILLWFGVAYGKIEKLFNKKVQCGI